MVAYPLVPAGRRRRRAGSTGAIEILAGATNITGSAYATATATASPAGGTGATWVGCRQPGAAISHHNLAIYLDATGSPAEAGAHNLAALAYRLATGLDPALSLRNLGIRIRRSAARGERYALPRLADILPTPGSRTGTRKRREYTHAATAAYQVTHRDHPCGDRRMPGHAP